MARFVAKLSAFVICLTVLSWSQGLTQFSATDGGQYDTIDLSNGRLYIKIPVRSKAGLIPFAYTLVDVNGMSYSPPPFGYNASSIFVGYAPAFAQVPVLSYVTHSNVACPGGGTTTLYDTFVYRDALGTSHPFATSLPRVDTANCLGSNNVGVSIDNTGLTLTLTVGVAPTLSNFSIREKGGVTHTQTLAQDPNGNTIRYDSRNPPSYIDSLNQGVLEIDTILNVDHYVYIDATGIVGSGNREYTVTNGSYNWHTNFGCPGKTEKNFSTHFVSSVSLSDGSAFTFTYEPTPGFPNDRTGRIKQITLPTGGTISYSYSGGNQGFNCTDFTVPTLTRTTSFGTTTYVHSGSTTTVTDATGNNTVYTFDSNKRVTNVATYQGTVATGTLLRNVAYQYTGVNPVTELDVTTTLGGMSTSSVTKTFFDTYGNVIDYKRFDFGAAASSVDVATVYGSWNGSGCVSIGDGIVDHPCSITVTATGTGTPDAQTLFTYDAHGNATQVKRLITGTSTYLTSSATYFPNGTLQTATDSKGTVTTYTNGQCNGAFPTNIAAGGLATQATYDCNLGVAISVTDANGKTTTFDFTTGGADPFLRVKQVTDPTGAVTVSSYGEGSTLGSTWSASYLSFGASISGDGVGMDVYGHPVMRDSRQGPGSSTYDTVATTYDSNGRVYSISEPCATSSWTCGTPVTTHTYDALGRPLQVTDGGGGTVTNSYVKNDVLVQVGPAPAGETIKQKQYEYDGLGRVRSVCEITTAAGSGSCAQANSKTGYLTKYTYNTLGNLTGVVQNAQAAAGSQQTRTFNYDKLERLISEANPESGTTTYAFDTGSGCVNSADDLVRRADGMGNVTCYAYDSLHRVTGITQLSGPNATSNKFFVYDAATVNGVSMANATGRLAEAYTGSAGSKITDVGFVYSSRGELVETWQKTPNSGGYYHPTAQYWENGALKNLWISGIPSIAYGVDGKGRTSTVSANSGQNPVTSTSYNAASQVTGVVFGSVDRDDFTFDPNSGRMSQYKFTINGQAEVGNLGWSANGTVRTLAVTNPFVAGDNQSCSYTYDDLTRIKTANCGSVWNQTFGYDAFGNITKSATVGTSWMPTYNINNRYQSLPGFTPTYDSNGDLLADSFHTYTWDADGKVLTIDAGTGSQVALTYDALGRSVEQTRSSGSIQIVYSPTGAKLALMNAQSVQQALVPLPGAAFAEYLSWGLSHYRHPDWLGSDRLGSGTTHTIVSSAAYAPFGEPYAQSGNGELSFTGQNKDTVWLQYDFLYRQYDPKQGRWLTPDPARPFSLDDPQSFNLYAYVDNSPLTSIDPLGLTTCEEQGLPPDKCVDVTAPAPPPIPTYLITENPTGCIGCHPSNRALIRFFQRIFSMRRHTSNSSWTWNFTKSFFTLAGGPGNVPTCAGQALRHMGETLNPFTPSASSVAEGVAPVAQAVAINRGIAQTQAGIDAYVAERGLTVPLRSSIVRGMAAEGAEGAVAAGARANLAVATVAVDYAAVNSTITTAGEARNGDCTAAFPVF